MWNHRIIRHKDYKDNIWYAIHEVFYDNDGVPNGCTEKPLEVLDEEVDGLKWQLEHMLKAFDKPILDYQYFIDQEKKHSKRKRDA